MLPLPQRENGLRINRLTDDYLAIAGDRSTYLWKERIESPAMVKLAGRYYMFGSHLTGWDANDNVYSTATSISGPWSAWQTFADAGSKTYTSQTTFILPYGGTNVMYLGDRWVSSNLQSSTYVWLPLRISGASVTMKNVAGGWVPNAGPDARPDAAWAAAPGETVYEAETAALAGGARELSCGACSGGKSAGYLGGDSNGTLTFTGVKSDKDALSTVRIRFVNNDANPRYAGVSVNGAPPVRVAFEPTRNAVSSSTLHVQLRAGGSNTIVISGVGGGLWAADADSVVVPLE